MAVPVYTGGCRRCGRRGYVGLVTRGDAAELVCRECFTGDPTPGRMAELLESWFVSSVIGATFGLVGGLILRFLL